MYAQCVRHVQLRVKQRHRYGFPTSSFPAAQTSGRVSEVTVFDAVPVLDRQQKQVAQAHSPPCANADPKGPEPLKSSLCLYRPHQKRKRTSLGLPTPRLPKYCLIRRQFGCVFIRLVYR